MKIEEDENIKKDMESTSHSKLDVWLDKLHSIKRDVDPSMIDMTDEHTKYIMSK